MTDNGTLLTPVNDSISDVMNDTVNATSTGYQPDHANQMAFLKELMTVVYLVVFIVGTPGNIWIIYKLLKTKLWNTSSAQMTVSQRSRIYIFALACSDLVLLITLPPTSTYHYYGTWVFGAGSCYVIRTAEMVAKLFSVALLTVMSLERYVIVCTRIRHFYSPWMSIVPLGLASALGVILPSLVHWLYLEHFPMNYPKSDGTEEEVWLCLPCMNDTVFNYFASYTFSVGFVIPFTIMTICYILLVRHVKQKYKNRRAQMTEVGSLKKEPRYMSEVRKSIWRIAVFHFVCWAPFWAFTMGPHYLSFFVKSSQNDYDPLWFVYCRLFANCLPYINAAGNWVLYALLNVDVRKHIYSQPKKKHQLLYNMAGTSSNV